MRTDQLWLRDGDAGSGGPPWPLNPSALGRLSCWRGERSGGAHRCSPEPGAERQAGRGPASSGEAARSAIPRHMAASIPGADLGGPGTKVREGSNSAVADRCGTLPVCPAKADPAPSHPGILDRTAKRNRISKLRNSAVFRSAVTAAVPLAFSLTFLHPGTCSGNQLRIILSPHLSGDDPRARARRLCPRLHPRPDPCPPARRAARRRLPTRLR